MKKSIVVRTALSAVATALTVAINFAVAPTTTLMASNAALGQMAPSDASYVAAITKMNVASTLANGSGWILLLVLVLIWGPLLFKGKQ